MFVRNVYVRVLSNFLVLAIGFVPFILIVKTYGKDTVGNIAYYYSLAGIFSLFADLGTSIAYNKFIAVENRQEDIIAYLFIKFFLITLYIIIVLSAYFLKFRNSGTDNKLLFISCIIIVLDLTAQFFSGTLMGRRDFLFLSKIEVTSAILLGIYNLIVCFLIKNVYFLAANNVVVHLTVISGGLLYFYSRRLLRFQKPHSSDFKKYIRFSGPIAFSTVASSFATNIGNLLLGKYIGMNELGLYQIASRCYGVIDNFIKPVTNTMYTEIVHRINNKATFFHKRFRDIVQILNFSAGIMILILIFSSNFVINRFFGAENIRGAFILKFFPLVILGRLFWRPYVNVVLAIEKHKLIYYLGPLDVLIMVGCYWLLMPLRIGEFYAGAAAIPLTEFIVFFLPAGLMRILILRKQYGNIHMLEVILKIWLPLVLVISGGLLISRSIIMLPFVMVIFLAVEYFLGIVTEQRLNELLAPIKILYKEKFLPQINAEKNGV